MLSTVRESLNVGERCVAVFLDLAKAFDTVPHDRLIKKLENYGVRGIASKLFLSYLQGRLQTVRMGNSCSDPLGVKIGIPQGTVLGPILFVLYVNDIFNLNIEARVVSFADDTVLLFRNENIELMQEAIAKNLQKLKIWLDLNLLSLNLEKTKYIHFNLSSSLTMSDHIKIHNVNCHSRPGCNCRTIEKTDSLKYLGVYLDSGLKWKDHTMNLVNKLRKIIPQFYSIRNSMGLDVRMIFYYALVESNIRYGILFWGSAYDNAVLQVQMAQKTLLKILHFKSKLFSTEQLFKESGAMTIRNLYFFECLLFIHTHLQLFTEHETSYQTRNRDNQKKLKLVVPRSSCFARTVDYLGIRTYNSLSADILSISNTGLFKKKIKRYILQNTQEYNALVI